MKLPRTGDTVAKINLAPKLVMSAKKFYHEIMKLPRIGDSMPKCQFGPKLPLFALKL